MNDIPSHWPWQAKLIASVLFIVIMAGIAWFAHKLAYEWLPKEVAMVLGFSMVAFAGGFVLGRRFPDRS